MVRPVRRPRDRARGAVASSRPTGSPDSGRRCIGAGRWWGASRRDTADVALSVARRRADGRCCARRLGVRRRKPRADRLLRGRGVDGTEFEVNRESRGAVLSLSSRTASSSFRGPEDSCLSAATCGRRSSTPTTSEDPWSSACRSAAVRGPHRHRPTSGRNTTPARHRWRRRRANAVDDREQHAARPTPTAEAAADCTEHRPWTRSPLGRPPRPPASACVLAKPKTSARWCRRWTTRHTNRR